MNTLILDRPEAAYQAMLRLKKLNKLRQREIAQQLGLSECEVVASRCGLAHDELGQVQRLKCNTVSRVELFRCMLNVGQVMVLTRNETVVHERKGKFQNVQIDDKMGLVLGTEIDLRLFLAHWQHAYAVTDSGPSTSHSIQFYDAYGCAIQKIYTTAETDLNAFKTLIDNHLAIHQDAGVEVLPLDIHHTKRGTTDLNNIDQPQFHTDWLAMTDVHQFFDLLKKYSLTRVQGYQIAPRGYTQSVAVSALVNVLEQSALQKLPLMIFVGNRGAIQIHTGEVNNLKRLGGWYNVLDPDFNLHIKEDEVKTAWVVRRPSNDGMVTSIDFFDANDNQVLTIFGQRKPGQTELPAWTALIAHIVESNT